MGKSINLNKLDFSKYNKAANAYKNGQIKLAFNELKAFKKKSKLSSLIELPEQQAYFEVLVTFQLAQIEKMEILFLETIKLIKALQTKAKCLSQESVFERMLAESYREIKDYSTSEKYFEKVFAQIDNYSLNKELIFNYFLVLSKQYKRGSAEKLVEILESLGDTKFKLAVLFEWLDFIIDCEDKVYALELVKKIIANGLAVSESIQWKLIQRTNEMLSEPELCSEMITKFNLSNPVSEYQSILSSVFYKSKKYQRSIDIITKEAIEADKSFSYNLLGRAYSQLKSHDKAFGYFLKSAEAVDKESVIIGSKAKMKKARNKINSLNLDMLNDHLLSKNNAATTNPMVFIIGFPRSGTTLLDSILRTQDCVAVLSERPVLNNTIKYIGEEFNKNFPEGLAKLSNKEIRLAQEYYLDKAKQVISATGQEFNNSTMIVDKNPNNIWLIPFIRTIFPAAKFITSLRHPIDTVFSCFTAEFNEQPLLTTYKESAITYTETFDFYFKCKDKLSFINLDVKYENLVLDFEQQISLIFQFLKLNDSKEAYKTFFNDAKNRVIHSASKDQANQSLYTSSVNKYLPYLPYIERDSEPLLPFIERLGY